jgi:hypothetical protein
MPAKQKPKTDQHAQAKLARPLLLAAVLSLGLAPCILLVNTAAQARRLKRERMPRSKESSHRPSKPCPPFSTLRRRRLLQLHCHARMEIGATKEAERHFDLAHGISLRMPQDDLTCQTRQGMNEERASVGDLEGALRNLSHCGPQSSPSEERTSSSPTLLNTS